MDNMVYYNQLCATPEEARKTILAGNLKGKTDINPMWRIKRLTEVFGPQGEGWKIEVVDTRVVEAAGESMVHCYINFYYRKVDGSWSEPIPGFGGNKLAGKGKGDGINDEAYKMAFTDAMSVCCKGLGMSADIHFERDKTKYSSQKVETVYTPVDSQMYESFLEAEAKGQRTPKGRTAEESWISLTHAGEAEIRQFRADVENYRSKIQL